MLPCGPTGPPHPPCRRRNRRTAAAPRESSAAGPGSPRSPPGARWCWTRSRSGPGACRTGPGTPRLTGTAARSGNPRTTGSRRGSCGSWTWPYPPRPPGQQTLIQVRRSPVPRVLARMIKELPHHRLPLTDGPGRQAPATGLLLGPALQHRLQHRVFLAQQRDPADQLQPGRAHRLTSPTRHPDLLAGQRQNLAPDDRYNANQLVSATSAAPAPERRPHRWQVTAHQIMHLMKFSGVARTRGPRRAAWRGEDGNGLRRDRPAQGADTNPG